MPAELMTFVHFCVSAAMNAAKSSGEPIFGFALILAKLASSSGDFRISLIAAFSLLTILGEVPAGATTPAQNVDCSVKNPLSVVVGTAGSWGLRVSSATARAVSFPASI